MGKTLEVLGGIATAPSATLTTVTYAAGNSGTIRDYQEGSAKIVAAWVKSRTAGKLLIKSPMMHDNIQGFMARHLAAHVAPLWPKGAKQVVRSGDLLTVQLTGSATAADKEIAGLIIAYDNLPGVESRLMAWDEIKDKIEHILTVENTITAVDSANYSGSEAINAETDYLQADRDYAILGYMVNVVCGVVRYSSASFAPLGIGGPGDIATREVTREFFKNLSIDQGIAAIPVFNSNNKGSVLIDVLQDEDATAVIVTTILAQLAKV